MKLPMHLPAHLRRTTDGHGGPGYFHKRANLNRPADFGMRAWDPDFFNGPLMTEEIGQREQPGLRKRIRMQRNKEAYCYVDPEYLAMLPKPPDHIQSDFAYVFGNRIRDADGRVRLKLALHPHLKRWCMYELHLDPSKGEAGTLWKCVWICQEEPKHGHLPVDYRGDRYLEHFVGLIGDYKEPERWEFEEIERTDKKKYGYEAVEHYFHVADAKEEIERERIEADRTHDFLSYYFNQAVDDENQREGSGQRMRSADMTAGYKTDERKYKQEQRTGYRIIERRSREDWERQRREEAEQLAAELKAERVDEGLRTGKSRSDAEKAAELSMMELEQRIAENRIRIAQEMEKQGL